MLIMPPIGANATFALEYPGNRDGLLGGLGISDEIGDPPNDNIYIGSGSSSSENDEFKSLPFFDRETSESSLTCFKDNSIERDYRIATDTWSAEDLTFQLYSPIQSIPNPRTSNSNSLKEALVPAVFFELTIDNTNSAESQTAFFGYQSDENSAQVVDNNDLKGVTIDDATG